jgi:rare lipoprotein A
MKAVPVQGSSGPFKLISIGFIAAMAAALSCVKQAEASQCGKATWYEGGKTASGEISGPSDLTAAHRTLPFGTNIVVENLTNGLQVTVRINDRGPFTTGMMIDLNRSAAEQIGMVPIGVVQVRITAPEQAASLPDGGC